MRESGSTHPILSPFAFNNLEDQTAHALHILRALQYMCEGNPTFSFEGEDFEAMSGLLGHVNLLLEPLDLRGVAGALQLGKFTIVEEGKSARPTIVCAKCSREKGASP